MIATRTIACVVRLAALAALVLSCAAPEPPPTETQTPPTAPAFRPGVVEGVSVSTIRDLHGEVALVLRAKASDPLQIAELWAVPLDGSAPRRVVTYPSRFVGAGHTRLGFTVLGRQLAPDARRIVVTVAFPLGQSQFEERLVVVDLDTTHAVAISGPSVSGQGYAYDLRPAWSPDGSLVAFEKMEATFLTGIWMVRPDGSDPKKVCTAGMASRQGQGYFYGCGGVVGWSPDGRLGFSEVDGYSLIEPSGRIERIGHMLSSMLGVGWRTTEPSLVAATGKGIATSDAHGNGAQVLRPDAFPIQYEPRWRPGRDDILFRKGIAPDSKLVVLTSSGPVDLATGTTRPDARCPVRAEWSTDGTNLVYLSECGSDPFLVRIVDAPGAISATVADRLLAQLPDGRGWRPVDLVVVKYP